MKGEILKARRGIRYALYFAGVLWFVKAFEFFLPQSFETLGIYPRTLAGSIGIITGPLIHGDVYHLISNTFPIVALIIGIYYFYNRIATVVFVLIYLMTGFWVWVAAREAYHIGASGIVYGLISFLLFSGFIRRDVKTLAVSFAILILYGSNMIYGLVPGTEGISWESHLLGAISGLFCAIYFKPARSLLLKEADPPSRDEYTDGYFSTDKDLKVYDYKPSKKGSGKTYHYPLDLDSEG